MADIHAKPAAECGPDHRVHLALAIDETAGMTRKRMRKNIAGAKQGDDPFQNRIDILAIGSTLGKTPELAEMHIDRKVGAAADLGGHFDDADAPARETADLGMRLDAANEIAVGNSSLDGGVDIDAIGPIEIGVIVSFEAANEIGRKKSIGARLRCLGNEMTESRQRHAGRP